MFSKQQAEKAFGKKPQAKKPQGFLDEKHVVTFRDAWRPGDISPWGMVPQTDQVRNMDHVCKYLQSLGEVVEYKNMSAGFPDLDIEKAKYKIDVDGLFELCLLYTSPSPRDS